MFSNVCSLDLKLLWRHPLAWIVLGVCVAIFGLLFMLFLQTYFASVIPSFSDPQRAPGVTDAVIGPLFMWSGIIGCFIVPLFACRIVSEQKQTRLDLLLFNSQLTATQIVLSKLVTMLSLIMAYLLICLLFPVSLSFSTSLDWGKIAAAILGLVLLLSTVASIALYVSSFTTSATLAMVSTFAVLGLLVTLYMIGVSQSEPSPLFSYISAFPQFFEFLNGLVSLRSVNYFLLVIGWVLGLFIIRYRNSFV